LFESIQTEGAHLRLRNAAFYPLAAFLFAQAYFTVYPLLPRVPAALFWLVAAVLLAGCVSGAVAIARAARGVRLRGLVLGWFIAAMVVELVCVWLFLALTFPWL
jgi:hypothetical protein